MSNLLIDKPQGPPLISIIMPCHNAEAHIRAAVLSVEQQTHRNRELIVVDDGSTDNSYGILVDLAAQYDDIVLLRQPNSGPYPARNLGLKQAKGKLLAFLDADDFWAPDCLEKLYNQLTKMNADLSYCGWQNVVEKGDDGEAYVPPAYEENDIFARFLKGCPWPIHAALVRAEIIEKVDGFSTRCFSSMDYDLWIRISAVTQKITRVPEVLAFYRWHECGQISSVKWKQVLDSWKVRTDFVSKHPDLIAHIPTKNIKDLVDGYLKRQAYDAFWKRDLASAQQLFRAMWRHGNWSGKDLKYLFISMFPAPFFRGMVGILDHKTDLLP